LKKILFLILTTLFLFNIKVSAASLCSYKEQTEINQLAANVKVNYEIAEEVVHYVDMDSTRKYFKISILNLSEKLYIGVTNSLNDNKLVFTSSDAKNGVIEFKWDNLSEIANFTFKIYTTPKTSCPDEKIKTLYLTTPRFNEYSRRAICEDLEDFYLCQEFVTFSHVAEKDFLKKVEEYQNEEMISKGEKNEENLSLSDKVFNFLNEYKWYMISAGTILVLSIGIIIYLKNRKQRDLKL